MAGYDFLADLTVLEVAQLGPDALGGYLADMGATVIKIEALDSGDPVRFVGPNALGGPDGVGFMHLRWNRGKKSVALDLRSARGVALFKRLAAQADVVIEGMRAGVLGRLGLGYDVLSEVNPRLVYCVVSGLGLSGPYAAMASHGPSFDAFGGLGADPGGADVSLYTPRAPTPVGMHAVSLHAGLGVLSAVLRARRTGRGALIDVAAAESAAHWLPEYLDAALNADKVVPRPGYADREGRMQCWPRLENYRAADGKVLMFMAHSAKAWQAFRTLMASAEISALYPAGAAIEDADAEAHAVLTRLFATRNRDAWLELLRPAGVPAMPVNGFEDIPADPHFQARGNVYLVDHPTAGTLHLSSTPVKVAGQAFAPALAPGLGADGDAVLRDMLHLPDEELAGLKAAGILG